MSHHQDTCPIGIGEAEEAFADAERANQDTVLSGVYCDQSGSVRAFVRALSSSEVDLLLGIGCDAVAVRRSTVTVTFVAPSVRARRFSLVQVSTVAGMPSADPRVVR